MINSRNIFGTEGYPKGSNQKKAVDNKKRTSRIAWQRTEKLILEEMK